MDMKLFRLHFFRQVFLHVVLVEPNTKQRWQRIRADSSMKVNGLLMNEADVFLDADGRCPHEMRTLNSGTCSIALLVQTKLLD